MVFQKFRVFGRHIFNLYETYPLLMNSFAGGVVYMAGEITSQLQHQEIGGKGFSDLTNDNWYKIQQIGGLGAIENGLGMLTW